MHRTLIALAALAVVVPGVISAGHCASPKPALATTQLPRTVVPIHYDVTIIPDAAAMKFVGKVVIAISVVQPTKRITLNALGLEFSRAALTPTTGSPAFQQPAVQINAADQTASFTFDTSIPVGRYRFALDYTGTIGTQAVGLFALDYTTADGTKRALYTQFENSDARRVIPSWDEPAFKTTFALEAVVPVSDTAVSNMPIVKKSDMGHGLTRVRFAQSPRMSTYLLFFGLGEFDRVTTRFQGTELGVITKKGGTSQAAFVLESSKSILKEYNDYFGTRYPLPKLDNIAAPGSSQFFSAMENWGAIFTFEHAMLLDPSISTQADKQKVFSIAAHEMAHQWFGNLVTMQWWDDIWLNEGFASWMEARTTRHLHPEWNTSLAAVGERERAMGLDALSTSHPVVQHVDTVEQATQAFDAITYSKGEAVIGMLEGYVGDRMWRKGVQRYMKAHAYGSAVSDDLWRKIEEAAGQPITAIAHDFTLQPGVPMIRVDASACESGRTRLQLTQTEFSKDQPDKKPLTWRVPVIAQAIGTPTPVRTLVSGGRATLVVPGCTPIIVNAGQSGYYRTLYAPAHFQAIAREFSSLPPIDQLGLMTDSWSLGLAGLQPISDFLDLVSLTPVNADPQIWGKIANVLATINEHYKGDRARQMAFQKFAITRLGPVFVKIGWHAQPGELDTVAILRNELIETLSALGDTSVINESRQRYTSQATDPVAMPAALRKTILGVVARHADSSAWEQLHVTARTENTPMVREQLYGLLSSTQDAALAKRALELALTSEPGETNSASMLSHVAGLHPDLAFDFAIANMATVNEKLDATSRSRFFPRLASRSAELIMIDKVKAYAAEHLAVSSRRDADTAAADIAYRIKVRKERLPVIDAWLAGKSGPSSGQP